MTKSDGTTLEIGELFEEVQAVCSGCGKEFTGGRFKGAMIPEHPLCDNCTTEYALKKAREERELKWGTRWYDRNGVPREPLCPMLYLEFKPEKFNGDTKAMDAALAWDLNERGVVLFGEPGTGKTWALYRLAHRCLVDEGLRIEILHQQTLRQLVGFMSESMSKYDYMIEQYCRASVLFIDDPFKAKITSRVEEAIFEIINERYIRKHPIVMSMNGTAKTLFKHISEERVEPLKRRLAETCGSIPFKH